MNILDAGHARVGRPQRTPARIGGHARGGLAASQKRQVPLQYGGRYGSQAEVKGIAVPFLDERPQFEQELDAFYATYPSDVSHIVREMDEASARHPE